MPEVSAQDVVWLLERLTKESVEQWILCGEQSVWPAIGALKVCCAIEVELNRGYQIVRRRKLMDLILTMVNQKVFDHGGGGGGLAIGSGSLGPVPRQ